MPKYETGTQTKNKILSTCRTHFYEEGYDKTTFSDIARSAGVNQGSIYYHFSSKENLLCTVMEETIAKNDAIIADFCDNNTFSETKYFLGGCLYLYKMLHDEKYRRFNVDAVRLFNADSFTRIMKLVYSQEHISESDPLGKLFQGMANASFEMMVRLFFVKNIDKYSVEEIHTESLNIFRRIMDISSERFEEIKLQIQDIRAKIPWENLDTTLDADKKYKS